MSMNPPGADSNALEARIGVDNAGPGDTIVAGGDHDRWRAGETRATRHASGLTWGARPRASPGAAPGESRCRSGPR